MSEDRPGPSPEASGVGSAETHVGAIFFLGDRAYKLKKPVDLGFLDFRDRAIRHRIVHRECELNRRLAPDVYLGVVDVGEEGELPCDHALVMRRMPAERALSALLDAGEDVDGPVREVARTLAGFHSCGQRGEDIDAQATPEAVRGRWLDNLDGLRRFADELLDGAVLDEIARRSEEFLSGREQLLRRRRDKGRIVDGHGDLLADDIFCLDDGPRILDCLEFDDRLRWLDALDDAACLAMDLEYRGDAALAHRFLDWYVQFGNDTAPVGLRHFYTAYRALVRTKVACLKYTPDDADTAEDARSHLALAREHLRSATVRLVMVGGPPGSGKTTLAGALADELGATLCSSDRIRKELAGMSPDESASDDYGHGLYSPNHTARTYEELRRRAGDLLAHGETVVVDASWSSSEHRDAMVSTAETLRSEVIALRCAASSDELASRVRSRTGSVSDADETVARRMADEAEPWPQAHAVRTDTTTETSVHAALAILGEHR